MEAAVRPLGIVSNSSCALLPFLDWVLQSRRVMDHRFGLIRTVRLCYRGYRVTRSRRRVHGSDPSAKPELREYDLVHVGLLNARGIENWLEIEITATSSAWISSVSRLFQFGINTDWKHWIESTRNNNFFPNERGSSSWCCRIQL
ncbi:hypothetical protein BS47DRAFT_1342032 [Hydnum rufescens UP504]|uniref:Uncharacterized protein n=1 Tax=Hydnum rufescens UP504 TaxID=1448309 RepID=A0A9P6B0P6_9AGAM|nr:hypothetical protein BS47DRAFT_1342032 [Hydnum rufescens UP504]